MKHKIKYIGVFLSFWLCLSPAQGMMGEEDGRPPEHFCPITMAVMRDPVVASDGNTYERTAIEEWLGRRNTSPLTNGPIVSTLVENLALKKLIEDWRADTSLSSSVQNPAASSAASSSSAVVPVPRPLSDGTSIPAIARGYEEVYRRFLGGKLIYRPYGDGDDTGMITLKIADLANPLEGTFDLSRCGDTGKYLSISTGYRKGKIPANANKVEIWFTPWFVANAVKDTLPQDHYLRAVTTPDKWDGRQAPIGIFWTWGGWNDLEPVDYLTTQNMEEIVFENLYDRWCAMHGPPRITLDGCAAWIWMEKETDRRIRVSFGN